jgi:hypothetical protein
MLGRDFFYFAEQFSAAGLDPIQDLQIEGAYEQTELHTRKSLLWNTSAYPQQKIAQTVSREPSYRFPCKRRCEPSPTVDKGLPKTHVKTDRYIKYYLLFVNVREAGMLHYSPVLTIAQNRFDGA